MQAINHSSRMNRYSTLSRIEYLFIQNIRPNWRWLGTNFSTCGAERYSTKQKPQFKPPKNYYQITMDIYTHVNMDAKRDAAKTISRLFRQQDRYEPDTNSGTNKPE